MEPVLFDGAISQIPLNRLGGGESRETEVGICIVDAGKYDFHVELEEVITGGDNQRRSVTGADSTIAIQVEDS